MDRPRSCQWLDHNHCEMNDAAGLRLANQDIQRRVAEIQSLGAELAAITVETLIAEAEAARSKAMGEKGGR
jgi:hypothetical protein